MNNLILHIIRLTLIIFSVLASMATAMAQIEVYQGATTLFEVELNPGESYAWEIFKDSTVNFAQAPGDVTEAEAIFIDGNTGNSVNINWVEAGIFFVKVTAVDAEACTNNLEILRIKVLEALPIAVLTGDSICIGDPAKLTVDLTGTGPWNITYTDGIDSWTINAITDSHFTIPIDPGPVTTSKYRITEVTDIHGTNSEPSEEVPIIVYPKPTNSKIYLHSE